MKPTLYTSHRGVSLTETVIAVAVISVAFLAIIGAFSAITKSIQTSKAKTLAANLAQEKIQILKQISYLRLMVTTIPYYRTEFTPAIPYDTTYYPPETIYEGGIQFTRLTYVQMASPTDTSMIFLGSSPDTGLKAITVNVLWEQDDKPQSYKLSSIYANPNAVRTTAAFQGYVKNYVTSATITGASVVIAENMAWQDITSSGVYSIACYEGSYTLVASKRGYYDTSVFKSVGPYQSLTQDFRLRPISTGTVAGTAWVNDHIVISQVVGSSINAAGFDQEYIELYNPTTSYVQMVVGMAISPYRYWYQKYTDGSPTEIMLQFQVMNSSMSPGGYFLIANTTPVTLNGVSKDADAIYNPWSMPSDLIDADYGSGDAAGIGITLMDGSTWVDRIGWSNGAGGANHPPIFEKEWIYQTAGLTKNEQYVRYTSTAGAASGFGNSYDSNDNIIDFWDNTNMTGTSAIPPRNKYDTNVNIAGTPAVGAIVSCEDGVSLPVIASTVGFTVPCAQFILPEVATGTWRVFIASETPSGTLCMEISTVIVAAANQTYRIPNASSIPSWPATGYYSAFLSSEPVGGFVCGKVLNASLGPISPNIVITANNGAKTVANTTNGRYILTVASGTYTIIANPTNDVQNNPTYVMATQPNVTIPFGKIVSDVDFVLSQGGKIKGWVTRDGVNALPGISVAAYNSAGAEMGEDVSGSDGKFTIINLATNTYTVSPLLDSGEKCNPSTLNALVTAGTIVYAGTFTVTGAFGHIKGSVTKNSAAISTGVLLVAATSVFTAPPSISSATLSSTPYYFTNSYEDGTYDLEVRGSTVTPYRVMGYYFSVTDTSATISALTQSNVYVTPSLTTTGINFNFP